MLECLTGFSPAGSKARERKASWIMDWLRRWNARPTRQLRLRETLALGERRFVAVVEFEQQRFLIGGAGSSVVLLAHLPGANGKSDAGEGCER